MSVQKKTLQPFKMIAGAVALLVILSMVFSPGSSRQNRAKSGATAELHRRDGGAVFLCTSSEAREEFTRASVNNDQDGIDQMIRSGKIILVPSGTPCFVVDAGLVTSEVRVTEGRNAGTVGFLSSEYVQAAP